MNRDQPKEIERHRAAIRRGNLSRPVRLARDSSVITQGDTFFDYGCGYGEDVEFLAKENIAAHGWDPHYLPHTSIEPADVVNLGYVLNVIESEQERQETLTNAWSLANKALIVAAQVLIGEPNRSHIAFNDGFVTSRNTFQKYYEQHELKRYIDGILGVDSIPVGLGIYFVFRDETEAETFRASRYRARTRGPRIKIDPKRFEEYLSILQPLIDFVSENGRLPSNGEIEGEELIAKNFRNIPRAFSYIKRATDSANWDSLFEERRNDMLVYLALSRFERRPKITALPRKIQLDVKAFFGSYTKACRLADELLFSLGKEGEIATACRNSPIGKFVGNALYVHVTAINDLAPVLRVFEGCASRTFGQLENSTIIKLRADKPRVSYLHYPDFDTDPHPALYSSMLANLRSLYVDYRDYSKSLNPPILHRKETFVTPDYPNYKKFCELTKSEERAGLLDETVSIGTRAGWNDRLRSLGLKISADHKVKKVKIEK